MPALPAIIEQHGGTIGVESEEGQKGKYLLVSHSISFEERNWSAAIGESRRAQLGIHAQISCPKEYELRLLRDLIMCLRCSRVVLFCRLVDTA